MKRRLSRFVRLVTRHKALLLLLASVWLMLGMVWAAEALAADQTVTMYVHTQRDMLNARRELTVDSPIEMRLERGAAVDVIRVADGWAEIVGGEAGTAWCWADYLADYPLGEDAPIYAVLSNGRVRVRETIPSDFFGLDPSGNKETSRWLYDGDTVEVQFIIDGWAYIGHGGYVAAEYLEPIK